MVRDAVVNKRYVHWAWVVLGSSFITLFINHSIRIGAYSVLLPKMIQDLDINMTQAGMIRAAYFFTYILFSPLMGWLTDRIGGRFVISFFCLFLGTGTFLMGYASSLMTAILFHGLVGVGASAMWTPIVVLVQKWFGETRRGLALGILSPSYALGFGLMGVILPLIVETYSWRMGWILLGISGWFLLLLNILLLRNDPVEKGVLPWGEHSTTLRSVSSQPPPLSYKDAIREAPFWLIGISYFFISIGAYIISDLIVIYGTMELKIPYPVASALISIMALAGIVGGFILMSLSDYIGRKRSLMINHFLLTLSILWVILAGDNILLLRIGIGCFGFFFSAIWPMYAACARDYFPKEIAGTMIGILTIFYGIGAIFGPILAGRLTDVTGTFQWSFGLGALTTFISAIPIGFLRKPGGFEKKSN